MSRPAEAHLPLKPHVFLLLVVMAEDGMSHGYALKEELLRRSGGRIDLGPGTLYRTLHRLVEDGLITESDTRPAADDDERRRYYEISALGRAVAAAEARRLEGLLETARTAGLLG